ncbi:MAG TPA: glycosyltransferase [Thermoanaerobaculia bacterium]|nr:glycosyltransferase [Thermoanaerobaculia bacterium]
MSRPLHVLLTNITLGARTGTELYVRDVALGLLRRGHRPAVYTPEAGPIATELRAAAVPVATDVSELTEIPDVIHGHHHQQTMAALLRFPGVPGIFVAHDRVAWHDAPPRFPRIRRYVAVDGANRERLIQEGGIPPEGVEVHFNAVDLARFAARPPLPERPRHALLFSNYAREDTHLPAVREACRRAGLPLDVLGAGVGRPVAAPEEVLGGYDLVFAKGRCALEALAVGAAVVLCDIEGLGPMVTLAQLEELRWWNFGRRALGNPLVPDLVLRQIERYDAADAVAVCRRVRETAGLDLALERLVQLYESVLAEAAESAAAGDGGSPEALAAELRAAGAYLHAWSSWQPHLRSLVDDIDGQRQKLDLRVRELEAESARLREGGEQTRQIAAERDALRAELGAVRQSAVESDDLRAELGYLQGTATWRLRGALLQLPGVRPAWQALRPVFRAPRRLGGRPDSA